MSFIRIRTTKVLRKDGRLSVLSKVGDEVSDLGVLRPCKKILVKGFRL